MTAVSLESRPERMDNSVSLILVGKIWQLLRKDTSPLISRFSETGHSKLMHLVLFLFVCFNVDGTFFFF